MSGFDPSLTAAELDGAVPGLTIGVPLVPGAQGAVFRGTHCAHGDVVLKVVLPKYEERNRREIEALKTLQEANIVRLLEHGYIDVRDETCPYTLTRLVPGRDIGAMLREGDTLTEPQARELVHGIAHALDALWQREIVHRDVKPGNIVWSSDETAVLIDLGIARHLTCSDLTDYGRWLGTPGFMSPEQASGDRQLTVRADVFGLGVTTYFALTGLHPFAGDQMAIMQGSGPKSVPGASPEFSTLLLSMMSSRPVKRPTARQVHEATS